MTPASEWSIKEKIGKEWQFYPLAKVNGRSLRQILADIDGQEMVMELFVGGESTYICGQDAWKVKLLQSKKTVVTCGEALDILATACPELLERVYNHPQLEEVEQIFPGGTLEQMEIPRADN